MRSALNSADIVGQRVGLARESAQHRGLDRARHVAALGQRLLRGAASQVGCELGVRRAAEGPAAVQRLEQRDAERELIAARIGLGQLELFGRHVGRRAHDRAGARDVEVAQAAGRGAGRLARARRRRRQHVGGVDGLGGRAREAEVEHARSIVASDQHVVGLEVAVDDALGVGGGEALAGAQEHREDLVPRARLRVAPRPQGHAADQLHRHEHLVALLPDLVHVHDVGVRQLRDRLGLAQQSLSPGGALGLVVAQDLDRDRPIEFVIVRGIDHAHAAGADALDDAVAPDRDRLLLGPAQQ
ncbi:MAG: hypothetical protein U0168_12565 [Nannocystaceae bacterium]